MTASGLPAGWQWASIGEVSQVIPGFAFKSKDWTDVGIQVVKIKNIQADCTVSLADVDHVPHDILTSKLSKFILKDGDILLAMTGATAGKVGKLRTKDKALLNQRVAKLAPCKIDKDYFWEVVSSTEYQSRFFYLADGAAQPNMSGGQIEKVEIPLPPPSTQRRIASILTAYDDLIENNTRRIAVLEEMARRIYEEWFVQFRFPGHEETTFLEDSKNGTYPSGWCWQQLKDNIELRYGKALKASDRVGGEYPVYGSSGVVGSHESFLVEGPGLIVGRKGNVGSVHWSANSFYPIDTVYYAKTDLPLEYVFHNLLRQNFLNNDAAVPGLNREQAYSLPFLRPSARVLQLFTDHARPLLALARRLGSVNANLRAQRDLLLPKLISGEIDVSNLPLPGTEDEAA